MFENLMNNIMKMLGGESQAIKNIWDEIEDTYKPDCDNEKTLF